MTDLPSYAKKHFEICVCGSTFQFTLEKFEGDMINSEYQQLNKMLKKHKAECCPCPAEEANYAFSDVCKDI